MEENSEDFGDSDVVLRDGDITCKKLGICFLDRIEAIETLKNLGKLQVQGLSQEEHSYSSYGSNMTGHSTTFNRIA